MASKLENTKSLSLNETERRRQKIQSDRLVAPMRRYLAGNAAESLALNDPQLREAENILSDYINATGRPKAEIIANRTGLR